MKSHLNHNDETRRTVLVLLWLWSGIALLPCNAGCLAERSFPLDESRLIRFDGLEYEQVRPVALATRRPELDTRPWVEHAVPRLQPALPRDQRPALTHAQVIDERGKTIDVFHRFRRDPKLLDSLIGNLSGLQQTAQVIHAEDTAEFGAKWPGFTSVQIPMSDGLKVSARIAPPSGRDLGDSYIVVGHGLFEAQAGNDVTNLSQALREFGHHVVVVELRGHGATLKANPDYPITFGVSEPVDLLEINRWLREERGARRVGLIGFCITAQEAMTAAWIDGGGGALEDRRSPIIRRLFEPSPRSAAFDAGILAVCPPTNLVEYANLLETPYLLLDRPVKATFQKRIAQRLTARGQPSTHSMWKYVRYELGRSAWRARYASEDEMIRDAVRFIDFSGDGWQVGARRLEFVRTPLLVVQSVNDPLGSAQASIELIARVHNPNVGLIVLPGGGHTALSAMSAPYYHSLVRAFFDPRTAPVSVNPCPVIARAR